jgi:hypothetical protein
MASVDDSIIRRWDLLEHLLHRNKVKGGDVAGGSKPRQITVIGLI